MPTKAEFKAVKANLSASVLEKKTVQVAHTYTHIYETEREPVGLLENLRSWRGKKYFRTDKETHTEYQTVDAGTNFEEFWDSLWPQIESYTKNQAKKSLEELRDKYFVEYENFRADGRHVKKLARAYGKNFKLVPDFAPNKKLRHVIQGISLTKAFSRLFACKSLRRF